nr:universal stress protein [Steroidobacter cummioxidans]
MPERESRAITGPSILSLQKRRNRFHFLDTQDLIVMGTHGRRGMSRLAMGSDAELVVRSAPMPVLLVRARTAD